MVIIFNVLYAIAKRFMCIFVNVYIYICMFLSVFVWVCKLKVVTDNINFTRDR